MSPSPRNGAGIIVITFLIAMFLAIVPLPDAIRHLRPEWTALVLIYWCMALPERMNIGIAWGLGLLVDVLTGTLLGEHALGYALIAYIILKLYQQLRLHPRGQQSLSVFGLLLGYQGMILWINGLTGIDHMGFAVWMPALSGMVLWPLIFAVLRGLRRGFRVT